ncbi:hypothetical protein [Cellulomonas soli]
MRSARPSEEGADRGRRPAVSPARTYGVPEPGESLEDYERAIAQAEDALELDMWRALLLEALDEVELDDEGTVR